jgi:hypothetical protein
LVRRTGDGKSVFERRETGKTSAAMAEASTSLASLPAVLLPEVVRWLPSPLDIASLDCTSCLFHLGAPRSAVEEGLRLRAEAEGREVGAALPAGEVSWSNCGPLFQPLH